MQRRSLFAMATLAAALLAPLGVQAQTGKTLKVVPHSNITILDPIWTTAFVTRNHGYMIYDTLLASDSKFEIKPPASIEDGLYLKLGIPAGVFLLVSCSAVLLRREKKEDKNKRPRT